MTPNEVVKVALETVVTSSTPTNDWLASWRSMPARCRSVVALRHNGVASVRWLPSSRWGVRRG